LTGTPLQNDIMELWAMLNFLMPELFESSDDFDKWFQLGGTVDDKKEKQTKTEEELKEEGDYKMEMIKKLHTILKPFMLRRMKSDLEVPLPDKIEINVKLEMTQLQSEIYT
jgi:SNF2 family DNA or RNA helicase